MDSSSFDNLIDFKDEKSKKWILGRLKFQDEEISKVSIDNLREIVIEIIFQFLFPIIVL